MKKNWGVISNSLIVENIKWKTRTDNWPAVVLSVIAFGQAQSTANDLMEQSLAQIHDRIEERLRDLLNHPYRIQRINADLTFVVVKVL